jgi:hypothetical protein
VTGPSLQDRLGLPRDRYAFRYGVAGFVSSAGSGVFYPFSLIYFHHQLDVPLVQLGLWTTIAAVIGALGVSYTGRLLDRYGARNAVVLVSLLRALIFACYPLIDDLAVFAVCLAVVSLANRTDQTAGQVIVNGLAPERSRARWFGLSRMTLNAGIGIGALVGGLLLTSDDYTALVYANAAAFALVALIYLTLPSIVAAAGEKQSREGIWKDRLFIKVALLSAVWMVVGLAVEVGLPVYLVLFLHQPPWTVSVVFAVNTALVTLVQLPLARYIGEQPVMRMFATGLVAYAASFVGFLALAQAGRVVLVAGLVLAVCVFTVGEMFVAVSGMLLVNGLAPPGRTGAYVGTSWAFAGTGSALAPLLFTAALTAAPLVLWSGLIVLAVGMIGVTRRLQGPVTERITESARPSPPSQDTRSGQ